jgi:uncharacterized protein (DUF983 family)
MFRDFYTLYERCPTCDIKYERESGAWLGGLVGSYAVGALCVIALGFAELIWHPLEAIGIHPLATIIVISLVVTALAYRPSKGAWFALLWLYEFTDEPETPPEAPSEAQSEAPTPPPGPGIR